MRLQDDRDASVCHFREGQTIRYKTKNKKAKIRRIWNNKVDRGQNRMFDLLVDYGSFSVPVQCFEYEIEEIRE